MFAQRSVAKQGAPALPRTGAASDQVRGLLTIECFFTYLVLLSISALAFLFLLYWVLHVLLWLPMYIYLVCKLKCFIYFQDDNEGPVTKSIRLTASLILRNLVIYSNNCRRFVFKAQHCIWSFLIHLLCYRYLKPYEPHLANVALSNVESSRTIAQVLYDMNDGSNRRWRATNKLWVQSHVKDLKRRSVSDDLPTPHRSICSQISPDFSRVV